MKKLLLLAGWGLLFFCACLKEVQIPFYMLTVENGTGSGRYPTNGRVVVQATPPPDYRFLGWEGDTAYMDRKDQPEGVFVMPDSNATLLAYCLPKHEPSFRYEVFPIIRQYCALDYCHQNSDKQPNFEDYASVAAAYSKMELYLEIGFMPLAGTLPEADKQRLLEWLRQGRKNN